MVGLFTAGLGFAAAFCCTGLGFAATFLGGATTFFGAGLATTLGATMARGFTETTLAAGFAFFVFTGDSGVSTVFFELLRVVTGMQKLSVVSCSAANKSAVGSSPVSFGSVNTLNFDVAARTAGPHLPSLRPV